MLVIASRTGNVRFIVNKLELPHVELVKGQLLEVDYEYILFTYTDGLGNIPPIVEEFLNLNHELCKGVIVSGNRNFGHAYFGGAGDKIQNRYGIPLLHKLELRGVDSDYEKIISEYNKIFGE